MVGGTVGGGDGAVLVGVPGLVAGGAAAPFFGFVAEGFAVGGLAAIGDFADGDAQGAAFADFGAEGPLGVDGADTGATGDCDGEVARGAGKGGGEGHDGFIGRLAGMSFTHIGFP